MSKQEKKSKKEKKAKEKAERIIDDALAKTAVAKPSDSGWDSERHEKASDEDFALGCRIRELREAGEAWWAIAQALELPGHGPSATAGKAGAYKARTAYKKAFGSVPRTFREKRTHGSWNAEKNENVKELAKQKKAERRAIAKAGKSVIPVDMPDEEVAGMLKGRRIKWFSVSKHTGPEGFDQEAFIHPATPLYIEGEGEERTIEFRERHPRTPIEFRLVPAQIRTVRLKNIYYIK